ncbi:unnamed protein product, partial [Medioppia subpectinata]
MKGFDERDKAAQREKEDKIQASLLILNELLRCSNDSGDVIGRELEHKYNQIIENQSNHRSSQLSKLFRSHTNIQTQPTVPSYGLRDLNSVVKYHKEMGLAPIPSSQHKYRPPKLSQTCRQLLLDNFDDLCAQVMLQLHCKNTPNINHVILTVIPSLAALNPDKFAARKYIKETIVYLLNNLRLSPARSLAFISLGLLAIAIKPVKNDILKQHLPQIMQTIRQTLPLKEHQPKKRLPQPDPTVFTCLALLSQVAADSIVKEVREHSLLDSMFATGLSEPLAAALHEICKYIPSLKQDIQNGLLKMLSHILMKKAYTLPGVPKHLQFSAMSLSCEPVDVQTTILALKVLGQFDFEPRSLMQFVRHCADTYLTDESREVRLEAVHTCCQLLTPALMKDVLSKLLIVGITDADMYVRYSVLSSLDERFDMHLAQAENLNALFICLNDEVFEIRELGLCTIGRLSSLNPAYVMPSLRKVLLQLLTELEYSGICRSKEQSAKMLGHLLATTPRLIRPYTEPILK